MRLAVLNRYHALKARVQAFCLGSGFKSALEKTLFGILGGTIAAIAISLVVYDILREQDFELPEWLRALEQSHPAGQDEIRHYVQFTSVSNGLWNVVTGIRYDTDRTRQIDAQWCYLSPKLVFGGQSSKLSLANKKDGGPIKITAFTDAALTDFNLTQNSARALVKSHCRFIERKSDD